MTIRTLSLAATLLAAAGSAPAAITSVNFTIDGAQEPTPTDTDALGIGRLEYDDVTGLFDIDLQVFGIELDDLMDVGPNSTPVHIHLAPAGSNGPIVIDLGFIGSFQQNALGIEYQANDVTVGGTYGAVTSDPAEVFAALQSGDLYVNIHTNDFPGGEIRGQIPPIPAPAGSVALLLSAGVLASRRKR